MDFHVSLGFLAYAEDICLTSVTAIAVVNQFWHFLVVLFLDGCEFEMNVFALSIHDHFSSKTILSDVSHFDNKILDSLTK